MSITQSNQDKDSQMDAKVAGRAYLHDIADLVHKFREVRITLTDDNRVCVQAGDYAASGYSLTNALSKRMNIEAALVTKALDVGAAEGMAISGTSRVIR